MRIGNWSVVGVVLGISCCGIALAGSMEWRERMQEANRLDREGQFGDAEKLYTAALAEAASHRSEPAGGHSKEARRERAAMREKRSQALGPLRRRIAGLEERISTLETETKRSEAALADPSVFADAARATEVVTSYRAAQATLAELYALWESAQEELSSAEAQLDQS